ncbi:hypothetical protein HNQ91_002153 [Filimonas zeae]|nr:beta-1,6-N-acetylglucosaminyltransferase [Filimonas zeae]MDR6339102.1 hypothetical protein [Filimonas zeae]
MVNALQHTAASFAIHIDSRTDITPFTRIFCNTPLPVYFVNQRHATSWGSFEMVAASLSGMEFILETIPQTTRIILLSGDDYPIKKPQFIYHYLKNNEQAIYISHFELPHKKWDRGGCIRFPNFERINAVMKIYCGSQWWSFPAPVARFILQLVQEQPAFVNYFKTVVIPDESFFQTLLLNSDEIFITGHIVNHNLKLIKWDKPYLHPRTFHPRHFNLIKRSKALFARKFNTEHVSETTDLIDAHILNAPRHLPQSAPHKQYAPQPPNQVILFLTNKNDAATLKAYQEIQSNTLHKTVLLYHQSTPDIPENIQQETPFAFSDAILSRLNYTPISPQLLPGSIHFPVLQYYLANPGYQYYWLVEDDVRYGDTWDNFFRFFIQRKQAADFMASHITTYRQEPGWHWWPTLQHTNADNIPLANRLKSFNPIFRISGRALAFLHQALQAGWQGHHEVLLPSLLHKAGFEINDFGGNGAFVPAGCSNRFYAASYHTAAGKTLSSMRFRPCIETEEMTKPLLYHPVKTRSGASATKSNCIIAAVGSNSLHRNWINNNPAYDLHLIVYDDSYQQHTGDTAFLHASKGYKFQLIHEYLTQNKELLNRYRYFYMPDDDILISPAEIEKLFSYMEQYTLAIAQPAIARLHWSYQHTVKQANSRLRYTNFVEIMQPCFSAEALQRVLPTFIQSRTGWGIDFRWAALLDSPRTTMAIIDDIHSIHTRAVQTSNHDELNQYLEMHGLSRDIYVSESLHS